MEIRQCTQNDFKSLSLLVEKFHTEAIKGYGLECDTEKVMRVIEANYKQAIVMVVDGEVVGVIGGKVTECPFEGRSVYQEMIWYVTKKHRGGNGVRLLRALEKQCKERGIPIIIMVALGSSMKEKLDSVYKMMGYQELETHYIRILEGVKT